jgi:hypothetical protein
VYCNKLCAILVNVWSRASSPRGSNTPKHKNRNSRPSEAEEKDLLESGRFKAVANLQKYQKDTRAWRDPKVKLQHFDVGNLLLLRSPSTESSGKFEAKWTGPYVVTEKTRLGAYHLSDPQD